MHTRIIVVAIMVAAWTPSARAEPKTVVSLEEPVDWGFGAKVRRSHVSGDLQRLFVGDTPGGATQDGVGLDFTKRTRKVELVFGVGFDRLDGRDGYYSEKDEDPTQPGNVDEYVFDDLMWFTIEFTAIGHLPVHRILSLRYGAGLGIGILRGEVRRTDAVCTSADLQQDCADDPAATHVNEPVDLWPVMPVVNLLAGVELRPIKPVAVHVDVGLHSAPYVGAGMTLYLW